LVFYLHPGIGKHKGQLNLKSLLYVRHVLDKLTNEYDIKPDQCIVIVGDRQTVEVIMAEILEGYQKYWGENFNDVADEIDLDTIIMTEI